MTAAGTGGSIVSDNKTAHRMRELSHEGRKMNIDIMDSLV